MHTTICVYSLIEENGVIVRLKEINEKQIQKHFFNVIKNYKVDFSEPANDSCRNQLMVIDEDGMIEYKMLRDNSNDLENLPFAHILA